MHWNEQTRQGNPAKSPLVNDLIKCVEKDKVRKEGKVFCSCRAMKMKEFVELIKRLCSKPELTARYTCTTYFIFQFHMIAHLDDMMNFKVQDITPNLDYPCTLKTELSWSKNSRKNVSTSDCSFFESLTGSLWSLSESDVFLLTQASRSFLK